MIDLIDLSDWKTKKEIILELKEKGIHADERIWRKCNKYLYRINFKLY